MLEKILALVNSEFIRDALLLLGGSGLTILGGWLQGIRARKDHKAQLAEERNDERAARSRKAATEALAVVAEIMDSWNASAATVGDASHDLDLKQLRRARTAVALVSDAGVRDAVLNGFSGIMTAHPRFTMGSEIDELPAVQQRKLIDGIHRTLAEYLRDEPLNMSRAAAFEKSAQLGMQAQSDQIAAQKS